MSTHDLDPSVSKMEIIERNYYHVWNIFDGDDDEISEGLHFSRSRDN